MIIIQLRESYCIHFERFSICCSFFYRKKTEEYKVKFTNMALTFEVQEKIFQELETMPCGNTNALKSNLEQKGVYSNEFEEVWDKFRLIGIIRHGGNGLNDFRYMLTDFGKRCSKSILSFRETEASLTCLEKKLVPKS